MARGKSALQKAEEAARKAKADKAAAEAAGKPTVPPAPPETPKNADGSPSVSPAPEADGPEGYSDPKAQELAQQLAAVTQQLTEARAQLEHLASVGGADPSGVHAKIEELSRRNADLEKQLKDSHPRAGQYPAKMEDMPTTDQIPKVTD